MEEVDFIRMKEYIGEELYQSGISQDIYDNPRYQMILNELSAKLMKKGVKPYSPEAKEELFNPMFIDEDGSLVLHEKNGKKDYIEKVYIDKSDGYMKRVSYIKSDDRDVEQPTIRTYDSDGIEICVAYSELNDESKIITKFSRRQDSLDVIRIQSLKKGLLSGNMSREAISYRKREDYKNLHDIFLDGTMSYSGYSKKVDHPVMGKEDNKEDIYIRYVEATERRSLAIFEKAIAGNLGVDMRKDERDD